MKSLGKTTIFWSPGSVEGVQNPLKIAPGRPKTVQNRPRMFQDGPRTPQDAPGTPPRAPGRPKNHPGTPQDASTGVRRAQKTPQDAPETPPRVSREPKIAPTSFQDVSRRPQNRPSMLQGPIWGRFGADVESMLASFGRVLGQLFSSVSFYFRECPRI